VDLCRAVAAVHKAGLLHRDIKTHNVMRETGGRIVLMDFGAGEVRTSELTTSRLRAGDAALPGARDFSGAGLDDCQRHLQPRCPALPPRDARLSGSRQHHRGSGCRTRRQAPAGACRPATRSASGIRPGSRRRPGRRSCAAIQKRGSDAAGADRDARSRHRALYRHVVARAVVACTDTVDRRLAVRQSWTRSGHRVPSATASPRN
jgi:hypothetical protein